MKASVYFIIIIITSLTAFGRFSGGAQPDLIYGSSVNHLALSISARNNEFGSSENIILSAAIHNASTNDVNFAKEKKILAGFRAELYRADDGSAVTKNIIGQEADFYDYTSPNAKPRIGGTVGWYIPAGKHSVFEFDLTNSYNHLPEGNYYVIAIIANSAGRELLVSNMLGFKIVGQNKNTNDGDMSKVDAAGPPQGPSIRGDQPKIEAQVPPVEPKPPTAGDGPEVDAEPPAPKP